MISIFILPLNHFWNWDAQREELTDVQREKERERKNDSQTRKGRKIASSIAISWSTAPIAISWSVYRNLAKHRVDCDHAKHRSQSCEPSIAICEAPCRSQPLVEPSRLSLFLLLSIWPDLIIFFFFFWVLFVFLYWGMNDIIYLFGNRENVTRFDDFFSGFCLYFCIEEWMILYFRLATKKMWVTSRKCVFYGIFKNTTKY